MLPFHAPDATSVLADLLFCDIADVFSKLVLKADLFHSPLILFF